MLRLSHLNSPAVGGVSYIVLAAVVLALGDGLVKIVSDTLSVWQLVWLRSLLAVPLLLAVAVGSKTTCRPVHRRWVALRSAFLAAMWILVYLALTQLSLPSVSAALYSAPVLITLIAGLAPGRRVTGREIAAVLLGFVGVLVLLRPGTSAFSPMLVLPLTGAVFYALAAILTASHCRAESPLALAFGLHLMFLIIGGVGLLATSTLPVPPAWQTGTPFVATGWRALSLSELETVAPIVIGLAVIAAIASAAMARAYQIAPAPLVAAGDYSYLVFSAIWSLLLFSQAPDGPAIGGMVLITLAGVGSTYPIRRPRHGPRARTASPVSLARHDT